MPTFSHKSHFKSSRFDRNLQSIPNLLQFKGRLQGHVSHFWGATHSLFVGFLATQSSPFAPHNLVNSGAERKPSRIIGIGRRAPLPGRRRSRRLLESTPFVPSRPVWRADRAID